MVGGGDQGSAAEAVGVLEICLAGGEDGFQDVVAPFRAGVEERRVEDIVLGVDVRAGSDQQLRRLWVVGMGGDEQRRAALGIALFEIGAGSDRRLDLRDVASDCRFDQHGCRPLGFGGERAACHQTYQE